MRPLYAPRHLETRLKIGLKRLRECIRKKQIGYMYMRPNGNLEVTYRPEYIDGKLIGAYTECNWQQVVEDVEAA